MEAGASLPASPCDPWGSLLQTLPAPSSAGSGVPTTRAARTNHSCLKGMNCTLCLGDPGGQETGLPPHSWGHREPLAPRRWCLEKDSDCQEVTPQQKCTGGALKEERSPKTSCKGGLQWPPEASLLQLPLNRGPRDLGGTTPQRGRWSTQGCACGQCRGPQPHWSYFMLETLHLQMASF